MIPMIQEIFMIGYPDGDPAEITVFIGVVTHNHLYGHHAG